MNISTELLWCGGLLAGLGLVGLAAVRPLSKRLEKAAREDFPVDIPGPDEAAQLGPSMNDVQAVIDELTRLATAPVGVKAEKEPGGPPTVAPMDRAHKSVSRTQRYAPYLERAFRIVRVLRRPFEDVFELKARRVKRARPKILRQTRSRWTMAGDDRKRSIGHGA